MSFLSICFCASCSPEQLPAADSSEMKKMRAKRGITQSPLVLTQPTAAPRNRQRLVVRAQQNRYARPSWQLQKNRHANTTRECLSVPTTVIAVDPAAGVGADLRARRLGRDHGRLSNLHEPGSGRNAQPPTYSPRWFGRLAADIRAGSLVSYLTTCYNVRVCVSMGLFLCVSLGVKTRLSIACGTSTAR